jgi:hypothetical protein
VRILTIACLSLTACLALTIPWALSAQSIAPDLSGSWALQADANAARNRRPITGLSIATQLVIKQSPTEVSIDSNTGTENAIVTITYKLDGREHEIPGPIGWDTRTKNTWDGRVLVANIRRAVQGPEGELVFEIRETYAATADTLTLERTQGKSTQRLVYSRK